ncbi:hypothetical protein E0H59_13790 [Rhizobium leguminosarum bv. viciae]|nr:hypothetical protein E0H59_13790 [Rhizobium leguminosarum bv. viciae]
MTFWDRANTEERLDQIDGGIECGMTSKQIAICLGAPIYHDGKSNSVNAFAHRHGRTFPTSRSEIAAKAGKAGGRISSIVGRRRRGEAETANPKAFSLFENRDENPFANLMQEAAE